MQTKGKQAVGQASHFIRMKWLVVLITVLQHRYLIFFSLCWTIWFIDCCRDLKWISTNVTKQASEINCLPKLNVRKWWNGPLTHLLNCVVALACLMSLFLIPVAANIVVSQNDRGADRTISLAILIILQLCVWWQMSSVVKILLRKGRGGKKWEVKS